MIETNLNKNKTNTSCQNDDSFCRSLVMSVKDHKKHLCDAAGPCLNAKKDFMMSLNYVFNIYKALNVFLFSLQILIRNLRLL